MWPGGEGFAASNRDVERRMNQSELKVPTCEASRPCAERVKITLRVKMRRRGSRWRRRYMPVEASVEERWSEMESSGLSSDGKEEYE